MKKYFFAFAALALLFACNPENNGNQNNPNELIVTGEALDITEYSVTFTGYANFPLDFGRADVGIMYDKDKSFENPRMISASGLDGNNKFTVTASRLAPSTTYYYKSYVQKDMAREYGAVKSFTTKESKCPAGAVDLEIVMTREDGTTYRLFWAKSNLCTSGMCANPEDYGDYYAWGETEPKSEYSWDTYKWCDGPKYMTKYNHEEAYGTVDKKTVLDPEDDAAHVVLGGKWRMPTDKEWMELKKQCKWTWTTENGVEGHKGVASNGNSIFLPAAGGRENSGLYDVGVECYYWSSSLRHNRDADTYCAWLFNFYWHRLTDYYARYVGASIRPVSEE